MKETKALDRIYVECDDFGKPVRAHDVIWGDESQNVEYIRKDALLALAGKSGDSVLVDFIARLIDRI